MVFSCHIAKDQLSTSDCLLSQLTCHFDDEHPGIYSTSNSVLSSDLLYACRFSPAPGFEHILALANEDGKIALQNTNIIGKGRPIHGFQAHENAIFDLSWCPSTFQIVTASGDQTSVLLDIGSSTISPKAVFRGHTASVKTVDFSPLTPCKKFFMSVRSFPAVSACGALFHPFFLQSSH